MHHFNTNRATTWQRRLSGISLSVLAALLVVVGLQSPVQAALTDIATTPLASTPSVQVKPNIMLLMDASGSMGWGHMPDEVETVTGINSVGYKSAQCNSLYYNPSTTYLLPKKPDPLATPFTAPSFNLAPYAGYASYYVSPDATDVTMVDLSKDFRAYDAKTLRTATTPDKNQAAYYYVYSGPQTLSYGKAPCTDLDTFEQDGLTTKTALGSGGGTWTRVTVTAASTEAKNFAMWYSFYRIRISMIKSAASIAFNSLTDSSRVGFILMQPKDLSTDAEINQKKFLAIKDFNSTQRGLWFEKLFSQVPSGASPAREGLARVGRYYAGKQDGINAGMPITTETDPVQYSCQRNFTIMTTDGYWNAQTESDGGGAVDIDGKVLKVSQDSNLNEKLQVPPIYDGSTNGKRVVEDNENTYTYAACGSFAYLSTSQNLQSTLQTIATTSQTKQATTQRLANTRQNLYATSQNLQTTSQITSSTTQNLQSTIQNLQTTTQNLKSTTQNIATGTQITQTVTVINLSTTQVLKSTTQTRASTSQTTQATSQATKSTTQSLRSTTQTRQSTTQTTKSTSQASSSTLQINQVTSQTKISTSQTTQTTVQDQSCNAATELCTYVQPGTCQAGGYISCQHYQSGPALVASCSPTTPSSANNYLSTTCATTSTTPTGTGSCTPAAATSANNYTTTTCTNTTSAVTPVASCTPAAATSPSWVATTCSNVTTPSTVVDSCTPTTAGPGNNYTATVCSYATSGPTGVDTCAAALANSTNNHTTTTCGSNNTTNVGVPSCTPSTRSSTNGWVDTTCNTNNTGPTGVPASGTGSCTASVAKASNSYTTTTCSSANTGPTGVPASGTGSCAAAAATSTNSYVATICGTVTTGPTAVPATGLGSCTAAAASATNSYVATTCPVVTTGPTGVASCTDTGPTTANNYTTTTCAPNNSLNAPAASCTASSPTAGNSYVTTTCPAPITSGPTPVGSCTNAAAASGNNYISTTCTPVVTGPAVVASCTASGPTAANGYKNTTCGTAVTNTAVATCVPSGPTAGNNNTTTTCGTNNTTNVPIATCAASGPTSGNGYTTTTCSTNNAANTPVASCTATAPSSTNSYVTTTCPTPITSGPIAVATCTPVAAAAGNNWTATTCSVSTTPATPVASCSNVAASAGNSYTATNCGTIITPNAPVATCTAASPTFGNNYSTITCPAPVTSGSIPIATCTAQAATSANNWTTTTCPAPIITTGVPVSSCANIAAASGNQWTATTCSSNNSVAVAVASCTPVAATAANQWTATTCTTTPASAPAASCTATGPTAANNYTTTSCSASTTTDVPVLTCTPSSAIAGNNFTATSCSVATSGPTLVPSCTNASANSSNGYTTTTCLAAPGTQINYQRTQTITTTLLNGSTPVGAPTVETNVTGPFAATQCFNPAATPPGLPTSPSPSGLVASLGLTLGPVPPSTCTTWPCQTSASSADTGSINSLADVAQYYYATDLRPNMIDNVKPLLDKPEQESDDANWQHMTTFAVGLGVSGTLTFDPNYRDVNTVVGDFAKIRTTAKSWPVWPDPAIKYDPATPGGSFDNWNDPRAIDDFWHAAVNGRGQYFSAKDPTSVVAGLVAALGAIDKATGTGAGAATSSLAPVTGDNFAFIASYQTGSWSGDLEARPIDLATGAVNLNPDSKANPALWSAQKLLGAKTFDKCDTRQIYLFDSTVANKMVDFSWGTSTCDVDGKPTGTPRTALSSAQQAYFGTSQLQLMSQYASMSDGTAGTPDQRTPAVGSNLVNFLRGQRGFEKFTSGDPTKLYRTRDVALGDFIDSQPVFVKGPAQTYQDAGYDDFKKANEKRTPMVYVGGNDGMLHAFYAGTDDTTAALGGQEAWAIIPSAVLPNLYKLADNNYSKTHQYYVDGSPLVSDVFDNVASAWKTLLVGGLNFGGKGYYAMDVTDPINPKALWEFQATGTCYDGSASTAGSDCYIGYSFGQPVITKITDSGYPTGRWVVLLTSGYNNVHASPTTGDGLGYLYVLDAITGKIIHRISTTAGSAATPSGLAQVSGYANNPSLDNTAIWVYGGDLLGNIWRFDVNDAIAPGGRDATLIGQATDPSGTPQPITVRPELAEANGLPMVFIGTGRFLGATDIADTQVQSVYGIVDPLSGSNPAYPPDLRASLKPMKMTQVGVKANAVRTVACTGSATQCTSPNGWVLDLANGSSPDKDTVAELGERVNVSMSVVEGTLIFASNVPSSANSACEAGGHSWLNYINFSTGLAVGAITNSSGQASGGVRVSDYVDGGLITGFTPIFLPSQGKYKTIGITSSKESFETTPPIQPPPTTPGRISWREIAQ